MSDKKFKTPNGLVLSENELVAEYGDKFNSLVQNNTFVEVVDDSLKKKDTTESTLAEAQSDSQSPQVEISSLSDGEKPKKTGASASSAGKTKNVKVFDDKNILYINRDPKRGPVDAIPKPEDLPEGYTYKIVQNSIQLKKWKEQKNKQVTSEDKSPFGEEPKTFQEQLISDKKVAVDKKPIQGKKIETKTAFGPQAKTFQEQLSSGEAKVGIGGNEVSTDITDIVEKSDKGKFIGADDAIRVNNNLGAYVAAKYDPSITDNKLKSELDQFEFLDIIKEGVRKTYNEAIGIPLTVINEKLGGDKIFYSQKGLPLAEEKIQATKILNDKFGKGNYNPELIQKEAEKIFRDKDKLSQSLNAADEYFSNLPNGHDIKEEVEMQTKISSVFTDKEIKSQALLLKKNSDAIVALNKLLKDVEIKGFATEDQKRQYKELLPIAQEAQKENDLIRTSLLKNLEKAEGDKQKLELLKYNYNDLEKTWDLWNKGVGTIIGGTLKLIGETRELAYDLTVGQVTGDKYEDPLSVAGDFVESLGKDEVKQYRTMSIDDVNNFGDLGSWLGQTLTTQGPILGAIILGGAGGLRAVSMSSGGSAIIELEEEEKANPAQTYSQLQKVATGWLYTGAEYFPEKYVTFKYIDDIKKSMSTVSSASRELATKNLALNIAKGAFVIPTRGAVEALSEDVTESVNIMTDIFVNGKNMSSKQVAKRLKEAGASGLAIGNGMAGVGVTATLLASQLRAISDDKDIREVGNIISQINKIDEELNSNPLLTESDKESLISKANDLSLKAVKIITKSINNIESFSEEEIATLIDINKEQADLKNKYDKLKASAMSSELKSQQANDLNSKFYQLEQKRKDIIARTYSEFNYLPEEESTKLKKEASDILINEQVDSGVNRDDVNISDELITKKAKEIYETRKTTNQENVGGKQATTEVSSVQPKTEVNTQEEVDSLRKKEVAELTESVENPNEFITDGKVDAKKVSESDNAKAKEIYAKYDKLIKPLLNNIKTQQDAIQEQSTGEVSVQPRAETSKEVEQGKPESKPESITEQGKEETDYKKISKAKLDRKALNAIRASLRNTIPNSFALEVLDAVAKGKTLGYEYDIDLQIEDMIENGISVSDVANIIMQDEELVDKKNITSKRRAIDYLLNIGLKGTIQKTAQEKLNEDVNKASERLSKAFDAYKNIGIVFDPEGNWKKDKELVKSLIDYAVSNIRLGAYNSSKLIDDLKAKGIEITKDAAEFIFDKASKSIPKMIDKTVGANKKSPSEQRRIDKAYGIGIATQKKAQSEAKAKEKQKEEVIDENKTTRKKIAKAKGNVLSGKAGRLDDSGKLNPIESKLLNFTLFNPSVVKLAVNSDLYKKYLDIISQLSTRKLTISDLNKNFISEIESTYDGIITKYNDELAKIDAIQNKIDEAKSELTTEESEYVKDNKTLFNQNESEESKKSKADEKLEADQEKRDAISDAVAGVLSYFEKSSIPKSSMEFRIFNALSSLTQEDIDNMDSGMLSNVLNAMESAADGVLTTYANDIHIYKLGRNTYNAAKKSAESKKGGVYKNKLLSVIPEAQQAIKAFFTQFNTDTLKSRVDTMRLIQIDAALKRYGDKTIYNAVISLLSKRASVFNEEIRNVDANLEPVLDTILQDSKKPHISLLKVRYNMLQNMYNRNKDKNVSGINTAMDFFKATLSSSRSTYDDAQKKLIKEFVDGVNNNEFEIDENGIIKMDAIETAAFDTIENEFDKNSINVYEASFFQNGNALPLVEGYAPVVASTDSSDKEDFDSLSSNFQKPSAKSGNLIKKTGGLSPINLNPFSSAISSIRSTKMQFHLMSEVNGILKGLRDYLNELDAQNESLTGKESKENRAKAKETKAVLDAINHAVELLLSGSQLKSNAWDNAIDVTTNTAYKIYLASGIRTVSDMSTNILAASIQDPRAIQKGINVAKQVKELDGNSDENMSTLLNNAEASQTVRVMESKRPTSVNEEFANRGVGGKLTAKTLPSKVGSIISQAMAKAGIKKGQKALRSVNEKLTSISDNLPFYYFSLGKFAMEFEKLAGEPMNVDKMVNDPEYLIKYRDVIRDASNKSNSESSELMGTKNTFETPLNVLRAKTGNVSGRNAFVRGISIAANFLNQFVDASISATRTSINNVIEGNEVGYNTRKIAAQTARGIMYGVLVKNIGLYLAGLVTGDDDDVEKLKKSLDGLKDNDEFIKNSNIFFDKYKNDEGKFEFAKKAIDFFPDEYIDHVNKMLENKDFRAAYEVMLSFNNRLIFQEFINTKADYLNTTKEDYKKYLDNIDKEEGPAQKEATLVNALSYLYSDFAFSRLKEEDRQNYIDKIEKMLDESDFYIKAFTDQTIPNAYRGSDSYTGYLNKYDRGAAMYNAQIAQNTFMLINKYRNKSVKEEIENEGLKWLFQVGVGRGNVFYKNAHNLALEYFNKKDIDEKFGPGYYSGSKDKLLTPNKLLDDKTNFKSYLQTAMVSSLSPTIATFSEQLFKAAFDRNWQAVGNITNTPGFSDLSRVQSAMIKDEVRNATTRQFQTNEVLDFSEKKIFKTQKEKEDEEKKNKKYKSRLVQKQKKVNMSSETVQKPKRELKFGGK